MTAGDRAPKTAGHFRQCRAVFAFCGPYTAVSTGTLPGRHFGALWAQFAGNDRQFAGRSAGRSGNRAGFVIWALPAVWRLPKNGRQGAKMAGGAPGHQDGRHQGTRGQKRQAGPAPVGRHQGRTAPGPAVVKLSALGTSCRPSRCTRAPGPANLEILRKPDRATAGRARSGRSTAAGDSGRRLEHMSYGRKVLLYYPALEHTCNCCSGAALEQVFGWRSRPGARAGRSFARAF